MRFTVICSLRLLLLYLCMRKLYNDILLYSTPQFCIYWYHMCCLEMAIMRIITKEMDKCYQQGLSVGLGGVVVNHLAAHHWVGVLFSIVSVSVTPHLVKLSPVSFGQPLFL